MSNDHEPTDMPYLVWVYTASPADALDAGTWLETTRELRELGWRVRLIAAGPSSMHSFRGVEVQLVPMIHSYFLRQVLFHFKVIRLLAREWDSLDFILFHQMSAVWLLPIRLIRDLSGRNRPLLVMDTRDLNPVSGSIRTRLRELFYRLSHSLANSWADGQTAITTRMVELVRIPPEQLWGIWPSGVNIEQFEISRTRRDWRSPGEPVRLIYIGRFNHERGLKQLCNAVTEANNEGMSFILSLAGDGPWKAVLKAFAQESAGQIRVSPRVAQDKVPKLLALAHVGVTSLPAVYDKKFQASSPIKLFEYMAAGLPILSTHNACHAEVVRNGTYAYWAKGASTQQILDALRKIWRDRHSLNRKGREAATAAAAWTWEASAKKLADALNQGMTRL